MKLSTILTVAGILTLTLWGCGNKDNPSGPTTPAAPHASFVVQGDTIPPATITFQNQSTHADSFSWTFDAGDNPESSDINPRHVYPWAGQFPVTLIAIQKATNRSDTARQTVTIGPDAPYADFTYSGALATPASLTFTNHSNHADRYWWGFDNGQNSIEENPVITYTTHGQYTVMLIATQSSTNRADTAYRVFTIRPGMFFLDSLYVEQFPFTNSQGLGWDSTSGPDLYYELRRETTVLNVGSTVNDLTISDMPVRWALHPGMQITDWSAPHQIALYEDDQAFQNDYIGSVIFSVNAIAGLYQYPDHYTVRNSDQTIRVELVVRWQ